jgi:ABC-type glycerol-3-phosphate transport system substrate-binding protein
MDNCLAIAAVAAALGIAGCATDPKAASAPSASKDQETITGSRIPAKPSSAQSVKSVSGDAWRRESTTVIGNQPRGN